MADPSVHELILRRRSGRAIASDPVDRATIETMLEAARWAPSSGNAQPWRFVVVDEQPALQQARNALKPGNQTWAASAPILFIICANPADDYDVNGQQLYLFDSGLAVQNLLLQGIHLGLVVHPMAGWDEDAMRQAIALPLPHRIMCVVAAGYPAPITVLSEDLQKRETAVRSRKELAEIRYFNRWSN
jgi:nitroreductase